MLGRTNVKLEIEGLVIPKSFLVSEHIDEFLLGLDFLRSNNVDWKFASGQIHIGEVVVPLLPRPQWTQVRRVYADRRVTVPASSESVVIGEVWFFGLRG